MREFILRAGLTAIAVAAIKGLIDSVVLGSIFPFVLTVGFTGTVVIMVWAILWMVADLYNTAKNGENNHGPR